MDLGQTGIGQAQQEQLYWLRAKLDDVWKNSNNAVKYTINELRQKMSEFKNNTSSDA